MLERVRLMQRIKGALSYKKPAFWIVLVAIIISMTAGTALLLNPQISIDGKILGIYNPSEMVYLGPWFSTIPDFSTKVTEGPKITIAADKFEVEKVDGSKNITLQNPRYVHTYPSNFIRTFGSMGLSDIDISSFKSKKCYSVLAEDGTDTGYRIFHLDDKVWVGYWSWFGSKKDAFMCNYIFSVSLG